MRRHRGAGRAASSRGRRIEFREPRERILIVCEGAKTEPKYFEALIRVHRLNTVTLDDGRTLDIAVEGAGRETLRLVEYAASKQRADAEAYCEIWRVFDRDSFAPDDFDNAVAQTRDHPFLRAAWSNEAFELWYILHFQYLDASPPRSPGVARDYYIERLNQLLRPLAREKYRKNDDTLYELLGERQHNAVCWARRLRQTYPAGTPCHGRAPGTTVDVLVERLLAYAPEYAAQAPTEDSAGEEVPNE